MILKYKLTGYDRPTGLYKCFCGKTKIIRIDCVNSGNNKSCGCLVLKHGHMRVGKRTKTYQTWAMMKQRCLNPKRDNYSFYGGRGIKIYLPWLKFENFLKDMGVRPKNKTLDRIDPNKNYYPKNCKWSTKKQQAINRNPKGYKKVS